MPATHACLIPTCLRGYCILISAFFLFINGVQGQDSLLVQTLAISGVNKTKPWVVLREMDFRKGDKVPVANLEVRLERNRLNIYNLGLFNQVSIRPLVVGSELHVIVEVSERWYIFGSPILRVEERNSYDLINALSDLNFRRLAYGLSVQWRNVTGRNETLSFSGQLGFSKRLGIEFSRPALFPGRNIDLRAGFRFVNEKEIILGTESGAVQWRGTDTEPFQISHTGHIGLVKRFSIYQNLLMDISYKWATFSDSLYAYSLEGEQARFINRDDGKIHYPSLTLAYIEDRRDFRGYPLQGYKFQIFNRLTGGGKLATSTFAKIGATWAHHIPLSKRWNFAYGTHNIITFGDSIPYFDKTFIGINRREFPGLSYTLRGYEPYAIDGTFVNMTKAELKFALFPRRMYHFEEIPLKKFQDIPFGLYITAFCDLGYVKDDSFNNQDNFLKDKLLTGYGMGLNIIGIYDMLLRIEYARNHLNQGGIYLHGSVQIK